MFELDPIFSTRDTKVWGKDSVSVFSRHIYNTVVQAALIIYRDSIPRTHADSEICRKLGPWILRHLNPPDVTGVSETCPEQFKGNFWFPGIGKVIEKRSADRQSLLMQRAVKLEVIFQLLWASEGLPNATGV